MSEGLIILAILALSSIVYVTWSVIAMFSYKRSKKLTEARQLLDSCHYAFTSGEKRVVHAFMLANYKKIKRFKAYNPSFRYRYLRMIKKHGIKEY